WCSILVPSKPHTAVCALLISNYQLPLPFNDNRRCALHSAHQLGTVHHRLVRSIAHCRARPIHPVVSSSFARRCHCYHWWHLCLHILETALNIAHATKHTRVCVCVSLHSRCNRSPASVI